MNRLSLLTVEQLVNLVRSLDGIERTGLLEYRGLLIEARAELGRRNVDTRELTEAEILPAVLAFVQRGQAAQQAVDALCAASKPAESVCSCGHALSEHYPVHRTYHVCTDPDCECGSFEEHQARSRPA